MVRVVVVVESSADHPIVEAVSNRFDVDDTTASTVYEGVLMDLCNVVRRSGSDIELASITDDGAPDPHDLIEDALGPGSDVPVRSVDETRSTITQCLADAAGARAVVVPRSPCLRRTDLDGAAMRLRRADVVLGPTADGMLQYLGVANDVSIPHVNDVNVDTVTRSLAAENVAVDFLPALPSMSTPEGLAGTVLLLSAYEATGRDVAPFTRAALADIRSRT